MSRARSAQVTLPSGLLEHGRRHRTATLRALTGHEEELLTALPSGLSMAERATRLLTACLDRLGSEQPDLDDVRRLTVGDREALLLHLRRLTSGDRLDCLVRCPDVSCDELIDVELRVGDLLLPPYDDAAAWRDATLEFGDRTVQVRFRLPTGADQEAIAALAREDAEAAAHDLVRRCVDTGKRDPVDDLGGDGMAALSGQMADHDPQAELRLSLHCPACGRAISTLFDTAAFLLAEADAGRQRLYEEVHALAWHYHWSEEAILGLTAERRRRYLDLIAASLERAAERGVA